MSQAPIPRQNVNHQCWLICILRARGRSGRMPGFLRPKRSEEVIGGGSESGSLSARWCPAGDFDGPHTRFSEGCLGVFLWPRKSRAIASALQPAGNL